MPIVSDKKYLNLIMDFMP